MSNKINTNFQCLCKTQTKIQFRRPGYGDPVFIGVTCKACGTEWRIKCERRPGQAKTDVPFKSMIIKRGERLDEMLNAQEPVQKKVQNPYDRQLNG